MLSPYVPSLDSLELLLAIGRTGSLARAGAERGISQAAVSMRVKSVEATVGLRLVQRGPTGSQLTAEGALLADWAREVIRSAEQLDAGIGALRSRRDAQLRIAASLTIAEHLLPRWLSALRQDRPGTAASLAAVNSTLAGEAILNRTAELGFVESPRVPAGLSSRILARDTLVLVCAPRDPLARRAKRPVDARELASLALVEREVGSGTRASVDNALGRAMATAVERQIPALEASSTAAVRAAVAAGVGPAVMSSLAVRDDVLAGRLVEVSVVGLDLSRELRAVWLRGVTVMGAGRALLAIAARG